MCWKCHYIDLNYHTKNSIYVIVVVVLKWSFIEFNDRNEHARAGSKNTMYTRTRTRVHYDLHTLTNKSALWHHIRGLLSRMPPCSLQLQWVHCSFWHWFYAGCIMFYVHCVHCVTYLWEESENCEDITFEWSLSANITLPFWNFWEERKVLMY